MYGGWELFCRVYIPSYHATTCHIYIKGHMTLHMTLIYLIMITSELELMTMLLQLASGKIRNISIQVHATESNIEHSNS